MEPLGAHGRSLTQSGGQGPLRTLLVRELSAAPGDAIALIFQKGPSWGRQVESGALLCTFS